MFSSPLRWGFFPPLHRESLFFPLPFTSFFSSSHATTPFPPLLAMVFSTTFSFPTFIYSLALSLFHHISLFQLKLDRATFIQTTKGLSCNILYSNIYMLPKSSITQHYYTHICCGSLWVISRVVAGYVSIQKE